jgi:Kef-type K+ transport system membrane component KefB
MTSPLAVLLLQVAVVLAVAHATGSLFRRLRQPRVMGEMAGGILLGPSLLGWIAPRLEAALFPPDSLGRFDALSGLGLILFMFLVGTQVDLGQLRGRAARSVVLISHSGIVVPFALGALLAFWLHPVLSLPEVRRLHFTLFMGTAMSITAFPVLARMLTEEGLVRTRLGAMALACAAVDDVTAWCLLAGVVMLVRASEATAPIWATLLGAAAYLALMLYGARRLLRRLVPPGSADAPMARTTLALVLLAMLLSAWATEQLGIHAIFGAFLAGVVMPKEKRFTQALSDRLEDTSVVLLLPLFFASAGLRTSIALISGPRLWLILLLLIATAIAGKVGGATLAARATGFGWRDAAALGALMNTRGLMELVALKVGLEVGVLSQPVFTMMVLMALVTTLMTVPLLRRLGPLS